MFLVAVFDGVADVLACVGELLGGRCGWLRAVERFARLVVDGSDVVGVVSRHDALKALLRTDAEIQASLNRLLAEQG